jgi:2-C-methyl-D-erythritol 2,4-cyclodiphosphate synthase
MFRIGFGYDAHRLVKDRPLILGGVQIPHTVGLDGHSDADVLTHAVMDAVIGALGMGDMGQHFPDTDAVYKDASSLSMLRSAMAWVKDKGLQLSTLDATVVAEKPKLGPHIPGMRENLARAMEASPAHVNIKATTTEGLGFCGRGEGMEAYAVVSLVPRDPVKKS